MTKNIFELDQEAREIIKTRTDKNIFVEAGAGSGKTSSLVDRMVAMVETGIDVSKICAITFTKAAAAEFYDRFQDALSKKGTPRCLNALENIDLCFMGTIDSFCNMVLSEHPSKAGIPSDALVLEDAEMQKYYRKIYYRALGGAYGEELKELGGRFKELVDNADKVFMSGIGTILCHRNTEIVCPVSPDKSVEEIFQDEKKAYLELLEVVRNNAHLINDTNDAAREAKAALDNRKQLLIRNWDDDTTNVVTALKELAGLRLIHIDEEQFEGLFGDLKEMFEETGKKPVFWTLKKDTFKKTAEEINDGSRYAVAIEFMSKTAEIIAEELRKKGALTFFDYLLYLRDTLKEDASKDGRLIKHIFERHQYFLIDEFQDTDPIQAEIFFYLTAMHPKADWKLCDPRPGSLFIVGDPKQSIYRFRGADVSAFINIKKMFQAGVGEVVELTRNFRSTFEMRSWFNRTFVNLLPEDTENQSKFNEIPLEEKSDDDEQSDFGGVYKYDTDKKCEPLRVANMIKSLVDNPKYTISDKLSKHRTIKYSDFMVITYNKTKIEDFMKRFVEESIPFKVEGKVIFNECPALVAASSILSAIANPGEAEAVYGALVSEIFDTDRDELGKLKLSGLRFSLFSDNSDVEGSEAVCAAIEELKKIFHKAKGMTASAAFSTVFNDMKIYEKTGALNMEYVHFALELLREAEISAEVTSLSEGAKYIQGLINGESGLERSLSLAENENKVHIANLHKVKGLEAPIVILAAPHIRKKNPSLRVERNGKGSKTWLFSINDGFMPVLSTSAFEEEKDAEVTDLAAEKKRLLYVGATRARSALIVSRALTDNGNQSSSTAWGDLEISEIAELPEELTNQKSGGESTETVSADELYEATEDKSVLDDKKSQEASYVIVKPSGIKAKGKTSSEDEYEDVTDAAVTKNKGRKNAAIIGTMVHKLMEVLVSSRNNIELDKLAKEIANEYFLYGQEEFEKMLVNVGSQVRNGGFKQDGDVPEDILSELLSADEVYCEVPFCYKKDSELINGVMDVIYKKDGKWNIIDYKTNLEADDLNDKYSGQLNAYQDAFREMTGEEASAKVWHICTDFEL